MGREMRKHFFFRFGSNQNSVLQKRFMITKNAGGAHVSWKDNQKHPLALAIYFTDFTANDFLAGKAVSSYSESTFVNSEHSLYAAKPKVGSHQLTPQQFSAVREFVTARAGDIFWIFHAENIFAFEILRDDDFRDGDSSLHEDERYFGKNKLKSTLPKIRDVSLKKTYLRDEVPEIFATTDTSMIMGTLLELAPTGAKAANLEIAEALISDSEIKITDFRRAVFYLSPIQLETFVFKVFDDLGYVVTSWKGGSKFSVDLRVVGQSGPTQNLWEFDTSKDLKFQIKRTLSNVGEALRYLEKGGDIFFLTIDPTLEKKILKASKLQEGKYDLKRFIGPDQLENFIQTIKSEPRFRSSTTRWINAVLKSRCLSVSLNLEAERALKKIAV